MHILTSVLEEGEWSHSCTTALLPEHSVSTECEARWAPELPWMLYRREKHVPLLGMKPWYSSQPLCSLVSKLYWHGYHLFTSLQLIVHIHGGTQKFPELLKKIYSKYLYKYDTLVPFEELPLRLDATIPALLPMLEILSKIFNGSAVKGRQWFSLKLCNVSKLPALQILLHPW